MSKLPNHYEALNVSNTASPEEVQASYNILRKMFGADQSMAAELDAAYTVLKGTATRAAYDRMMVEAMNKKVSHSVLPPLPIIATATATATKKKKKVTAKALSLEATIDFSNRQRQSLKEVDADLSSKIMKIACSIAIVGSILLGIATNKDTLSRLSFMGLQDVTDTTYVRPLTAPNGTAFPAISGYIANYEVGSNLGTSTLNVSNSKNDNDVYLKLLTVEENKKAVVRHVFIKARTDFKLEQLAPGKYEVQYLDLVAGQGGKSEIFTVTDSKSILGATETISLSLNLKTAVDGVLRVEKVSIQEFNSLASL